ncbi:hypothetical protein [Telmatospirillum sp.]|uniref:hypothetical protein n=1 Tax=Telmatospirillum sp. TaxID=2079197 RepID=UPI0028456E67|nr:hypothetical protein [Telmatospirillum sp.]MDR3439752.1 hypothetical protein [Telmatospirillum sp.]
MERPRHRDPDTKKISWHFFRAGGFDQVRVDSGATLMALGQLDQKLWAALSCPTSGIEFDRRTLDLVDSDGDGRIRAGEIIEAVSWAGQRLKDPDILLKGLDNLPLAAINDADPEGQHLLAAARRILASRGKGDALSISVDEVSDTEKVFADTVLNGDGIVPAEAADDPFVAAVIADIVVCLGGETDRSGKPGVSHDMVAAFFEHAEAYAAWGHRKDGEPALIPAGDGTAEAFAALSAVAGKIDDYFIRCSLAAFDSRSAGPLNRSATDWEALAGRRLTVTDDCLADFPLAGVAAGQPLPLSDGLNPVWAEAMERFRTAVITPILGQRENLSDEEWQRLKTLFLPYCSWQADKPAAVDRLGLARIDEILASGVRAAIDDLIGRDLALADEAAAIASVDRLLRYTRDIATLVDNFVAFRDFYTRRHKAVFQSGTLFIDGRSCDLCVRVDNVEKHAVLATLSRIYLLYCECRRRGSDDRIIIAAAVTAGDSDQLMIGRNGIFYDRQGNDWDATVIRIIEHPISIRQAFWSPYKKLGKLVGAQLEKAASARTVAIESHATSILADPKKPAPGTTAAPPFDAGRFAGIFAAAGLALGAIGTAVASLVTGFLGLPWWQIPLAFIGLVLAVSGPSMVVASFKLHQRNIGPILDANGWAVNTRARINIPFGGVLTELARLPEGANRSLKDPYAEKRSPWGLYGGLTATALALAAAWRFGLLDRLLHLAH